MRRTSKELRPAPGELRIVQEFVNTADLVAKMEALSSPLALADGPARHALLSTGGGLVPANRRQRTPVSGLY